MRHRAIRIWWKPWRRRCACGCGWFPCPDSITIARPARDDRRNVPAWNAPTARYPATRNERPFMTPGQQWRTRQGGRR